MIKKAIEKIEQMSAPVFEWLTPVDEDKGFLVSSKKLYPVELPNVPSIRTVTLSSIVDYLAGNRDRLNLEDLVILVAGPREVQLMGRLTMCPAPSRRLFVQCSMDIPFFPLGKWMDVETFIIFLQVSFLGKGELPDVFKLAGNVKDSRIKTLTDDGITQEVSVRTGVASVEPVAVKNPYLLHPRRTFPEVVEDVPPGLFNLRYRKGGGGDSIEISLFEAGEASWNMEAMKRIQIWFQEKLEELKLDLPVLA